jgi:hypothetical protein
VAQSPLHVAQSIQKSRPPITLPLPCTRTLVLMSRSSAWQSLRRRTRSTRPATTLNASLYRGPRVAVNIAAEHVRRVWPSDARLEEWKSLEFRHLKPPSDEDWNR